MKIGILGSRTGRPGIGKAFLSEGHEVMLGTRNTSKEEVVKWKKKSSGLTGTFSDAAKSGEILVLATAGSVTEDVVRQAGINNFSDKIVIDATNPIAAAAPVNGVLKLFTGPDESLMERIQQLIPEAKVVKAFNSAGNTFMYKPNFPAGKPTMFICGNDDNARKIVTDILTVFGWETEDMGKAEAARAIEQLCILWCIPGMLRNQWTHAFKLLKV